MTHILANFGAIDSGAQVHQSGAAALRDSGDMNLTRFRGSADYWSDIAQSDGLNVTGQQWYQTNDGSVTVANDQANKMRVVNSDYQSTLQQSLGILSSL